MDALQVSTRVTLAKKGFKIIVTVQEMLQPNRFQQYHQGTYRSITGCL